MRQAKTKVALILLPLQAIESNLDCWVCLDLDEIIQIRKKNLALNQDLFRQLFIFLSVQLVF